MSLVLGIDAAWTAHNPSGVALVAAGERRPRLIRAAPSFEDFTLGTEPKAWCCGRHEARASLAEVLEKAEEIGGAEVCVITVDMPIAREPVRCRRCCDRLISSKFGAQGCATHSPTDTRPGPVSDRLLQEAQDEGFSLVTTTGERPSRALLEVYPHVALLKLCGREKRLPYKLSRRRKNFPGLDAESRLRAVKSEWNGILACLKREIDMDIEIDDEIRTLRVWKAWEDVIDAIVCAWVGVEWLAGRARAYGDALAAIWIPERNDIGAELAR